MILEEDCFYLKNIVMKRWNKISLNFVLVNSLLFSWIFINENSVFPLEDALPMILIYFIIISIQLIIIKYSKRLDKLWYVLFSSGNLIYFNLILNGEKNTTNLVILLFFTSFFILICHLKNLLFIYIFSSFFLFINFFKSTYDFQKKEEEHKISDIYKYRTKRNIFFVGIDGMISSEMFAYVFNSNSEAIRKLDSLNFQIIDFNSAGESTLETYAKVISYKQQLHPRVYLQRINSDKSAFNLETHLSGYKKQFVFFSNYFGGDPNKIFDLYHPEHKSILNFTNFIDDRWGWYSVRIFKLLMRDKENNFSYKKQMNNIYEQIGKLDLRNERWISIAHLWYPGHTAGNYNSSDWIQFTNYKNYYEKSQVNLSFFFDSITKNILKKDSKAIIVFWGDHGAYFFKGGKSIDQSTLIKDKKMVTLAVYPKNYLSKSDIELLQANPEKLFNIILNRQYHTNQ